MSDKIYGAWRFEARSLIRLLAQLHAFKRDLQPLYERLTAERVAALAYGAIDWARHEGRPAPHPLFDAISDVMKREEEAKASLRRSYWDTQFEISVIPHKGRIYGQAYTQQQTFRDAFAGSGIGSDYSYWNSTDDRPEGVSQREWEARGRIWNEIMATAGTIRAGRAGFYYDCTPDPTMVMPESAMGAAPDATRRARGLALKIAERDHVPGDGEGAYKAAKAIAKLADSMVPSLIPTLREITKDDLLGKTHAEKVDQ